MKDKRELVKDVEKAADKLMKEVRVSFQSCIVLGEEDFKELLEKIRLLSESFEEKND